MSRHRLTRREVAKALILLAAGPLVPARGLGADSAGCGSALWEGLDVTRLGVLGTDHHQSHPNDPGLQEVRSLVAEAAHSQGIARLRTLMLDDYAALRIVSLGGMFVSLTEARICAVLAECD